MPVFLFVCFFCCRQPVLHLECVKPSACVDASDPIPNLRCPLSSTVPTPKNYLTSQSPGIKKGYRAPQVQPRGLNRSGRANKAVQRWSCWGLQPCEGSVSASYWWAEPRWVWAGCREGDGRKEGEGWGPCSLCIRQ